MRPLAGAGRAGRTGGHRAYGADDGRGRARRRLRARPDRCRARALQRCHSGKKEPPPPASSRAFWSVPWPPMGDRDLPEGPRVYPGARLRRISNTVLGEPHAAGPGCDCVISAGKKDAPPAAQTRPLWWRDEEGRNKMPLRGKVVITCAVTGSIHTPTMSPYLPLTPDEIARDAIAAAEAGAAILHLHARDPKDGRPTPDPEVFMQFLPRIKQATGAVVNITTGGGHGMTLEERLAAPLRAKPEMCSMNMGSMNFGLYPMLDRYKEWKYDWEPKALEMTRDFIFRNTFADIEKVLKQLGEECGTRFEHECYDVGHLYNLAHFVDRGLIKLPFFIQTIFGILCCTGAH